MTKRKPAKSQYVIATNSGDLARKVTASETRGKRRFRTRKEWHVMGDLGERGAATLRIYAPNNDAAIAEAHARGMSVHECIQIPATRK